MAFGDHAVQQQQSVPPFFNSPTKFAGFLAALPTDMSVVFSPSGKIHISRTPLAVAAALETPLRQESDDSGNGSDLSRHSSIGHTTPETYIAPARERPEEELLEEEYAQYLASQEQRYAQQQADEAMLRDYELELQAQEEYDQMLVEEWLREQQELETATRQTQMHTPNQEMEEDSGSEDEVVLSTQEEKARQDWLAQRYRPLEFVTKKPTILVPETPSRGSSHSPQDHKNEGRDYHMEVPETPPHSMQRRPLQQIQIPEGYPQGLPTSPKSLECWHLAGRMLSTHPYKPILPPGFEYI